MIELLIVIAIIGMLAALSGGNYTTSLKRGRDTQRRGDMKKVQQAFEQYFGANQLYDATCANMASGYFVGPYPPTDPRGNSYTITCAVDSYCACALLEDSNGNATDASCTYAVSGNYFCVSNLQ